MSAISAQTIARLARVVSEDEATALIEQYGRTVASVAVAIAVAKAYDDVLGKLVETAKSPVCEQ